MNLDINAIRHIEVHDHYCSLHYVSRGVHRRVDLSLPLRDAHASLPTQFLRVHRSHLINVDHVSGLKRRGRSHAVILGDEVYRAVVPVSRHRLKTVLPRLPSQLV